MMRKLTTLLLCLLALPVFADPTQCWRAEATTLDGTDDYSLGDTTAATNGSVTISPTAALFGSNGILALAGGDSFSFDGLDIFAHAEGAFAFAMQRIAGTTESTLAHVGGVTPANQVSVTWDANNIVLRHRADGATNVTATLNDGEAASSTGVTQFVVVRWDTAADLLTVELYDASRALLDDATTNSGMDAASDTYTISLGNVFGGSSNDFYIDNFVLADAYDEPLEDILDFTSCTEVVGADASIPAMIRHLRQMKQ
jgi:hypothetical protein